MTEEQKTKKSKKQHNKIKKENKNNIIIFAVVVVVIVALAFFIYHINDIFGTKKNIHAIVNGEKITDYDLMISLMKIPPEYRDQITKDLLLNQTIQEKLVEQEARKAGIKITKNEVEEAINFAIEQSGLTKEDFEAKIKEQNITFDILREVYESTFMVSRLLNQTVLSGINVQEDEIKEYYENNKESFFHPEQRTVTHILISTQSRAETDALKIANEVYEKAVSGANFTELVLNYSEDPGKTMNNGIYTFAKGFMVKEFEDASFRMRKGEISKPVKTQFGYHIIKLEEIIPQGTYTYEEMKDRIYDYLLLQKQRDAVKKYVDELMKKAKIEYKSTGVTGLLAQVGEKKTEFPTFLDSGMDICKINGKPIIRMYTTTWGEHAQWARQAFADVVQEYGGKIVAYQWMLDTGDDALTKYNETALPTAEFELYKKITQKGSVPVFLFGCKYYRIGNGYETKNDLEAEKAEYRQIIEALLR